eukprot:COSAG04_NODE_1361_length_7086_cov_30.584800_1_plen_84_part_10
MAKKRNYDPSEDSPDARFGVSLQWAYAERLVFDARRVYATVNFHHKHEAGNFGAVVGELEGQKICRFPPIFPRFFPVPPPPPFD